MCNNVEFEFEDDFASPCTPDDCEARFKDFCEGKDDKVEWYDQRNTF